MMTTEGKSSLQRAKSQETRRADRGGKGDRSLRWRKRWATARSSSDGITRARAAAAAVVVVAAAAVVVAVVETEASPELEQQ